MIRVLVFFALLFAVALGAAWMADLPGVVSISWDGYVWEQPPVVVAVVLAALLAAFLFVVWVIRVILNSPKIATRFFRQRRKDKGYQALSQGLIALGTGNAKLARRHGLDADKFLSDEPATKLLLAQTAQLAGKDEEARKRFEDMLADPQTRPLGLHGLFIEAEKQGEPAAARHYAEEAVKAVPGLEWAGNAVLGYQAVASDWEQALQSLERNYSAKLLDKKSYRRQRAVILTAHAQQLEDQDSDKAFATAKEAHGLAQNLVPAATIAARLATRRGDIRKASKMLETTWRLAPHPELADAYAHVRSGDSAVDRLKRVKALAGQRTNTAVGALAIARAAMEAREFDEAREQMKKVLRSEPTRGAFMMMAELEELEHGDRGRMREWLAKAVNAPLDKAWIADGVVQAEWAAVSPVTGRLDAFEWATPNNVERETQVIEDSLFEAPQIMVPQALSAEPSNDVVDVDPAENAKVVNPLQDPKEPPKAEASVLEGESKPETDTSSAPEPAKGAEAAAEPAADKAPPATVVPERTGLEGTTDDAAISPKLKDLPDAPVETPAPKAAETQSDAKSPPADDKTGTSPSSSEAAPEEADAAKTAEASKPVSDVKVESPDTSAKDGNGKAEKDLKKPIEFAFNRMPDDPGPEDDDEPKKATRPRFFN